MSVWEKVIWNWSKIIGIFLLFHYLSYVMKTLVKSIIHCQNVPLDRFYKRMFWKLKNSGFFGLCFFDLSKSGNVLFILINVKWKLSCHLNINCHWQEITHCDAWTYSNGSCWATGKYNILCLTFCIDISSWKKANQY